MEDKFKTMMDRHNKETAEIVARHAESEAKALEKYHAALHAIHDRHILQSDRRSRFALTAGVLITLSGFVIAMATLLVFG